MLTNDPAFRADLIETMSHLLPLAKANEEQGVKAMFVPIESLAILFTAASDAIELTASLSDTAQTARVIGLEVYENGEPISPERLDAAVRVLADDLARRPE